MSDLQTPCTREDLRADVPQYNRWYVDDRGFPDTFGEYGDPDGSVEEYVCGACGMYFTPDGDSTAAFELAWQEALSHLKVGEAQS